MSPLGTVSSEAGRMQSSFFSRNSRITPYLGVLERWVKSLFCKKKSCNLITSTTNTRHLLLSFQDEVVQLWENFKTLRKKFMYEIIKPNPGHQICVWWCSTPSCESRRLVMMVPGTVGKAGGWPQLLLWEDFKALRKKFMYKIIKRSPGHLKAGDWWWWFQEQLVKQVDDHSHCQAQSHQHDAAYCGKSHHLSTERKELNSKLFGKIIHLKQLSLLLFCWLNKLVHKT